MRLAENSVPKINSFANEENYGRKDELFFCNAEEEILNAMRVNSGKTLLVFEEQSCSVLPQSACHPKAVSMVIGEDCLPLFSMPDGISLVIGIGKGQALLAARFFAALQRVPCKVTPLSATLEGVYEQEAKLKVGEDAIRAPLAPAQAFCDEALLTPTLSRAWARLLLCELERFEAKALKAFGLRYPRRELFELPSSFTFSQLVQANAQAGECLGEGAALARLLEEDGEKQPEWQAFLQLSALYVAFFEKGKPRRYFTPDYKKRALIAGGNRSPVPSVQEYADRAIALERCRGSLAKEILRLLDEKEKYYRVLTNLASDDVTKGSGYARLKFLPERYQGLSAVIRDFGLMEFSFQKFVFE